MTDLRQAAQQALEALIDAANVLSAPMFNDAAAALRTALAQPEQEPVAWGVFEGNLHDMFFTQEEAQEMADLKGSHAEVRPLYTIPPEAQQEQEPVAFYHPHKGFYWAKPTHIAAPTVVDVPPLPLYVKWKLAQRPWQSLTEKDWEYVKDSKGTSLDTFDHGAAWAADQLMKRNT